MATQLQLQRLEDAEAKLKSLQAELGLNQGPEQRSEEIARLWDDFALRMQMVAISSGYIRSAFMRCPDDYYEWELERRQRWLNASSVDMLCKSVVFENARWSSEYMNGRTGKDDALLTVAQMQEDPMYPKYVCVIVQYVRRLDTDLLIKMYYEMNSGRGIPRKAFNFRLATDVESVTGYSNNAVAPLGSKMRNIPVILTKPILKLDYIWLGGGEVNLKWKAKVQELVEIAKPVISDITA